MFQIIKILKDELRVSRLRLSLGMMLIIFLSSCVSTDDIYEDNREMVTLQVRSQAGTSMGDGLDNVIESLRILAFNPLSGECLYNKLFNVNTGGMVSLQVKADTYKFVFVANEPSADTSPLNFITNRSELDGATVSESNINSTSLIPMVQEIVGVEVSRTQATITGDENYPNGSSYNILPLKLRRLACRVDVLLEADEDLSALFTGVTFSNIPVGVSLLSKGNGSFDRTLSRSFTVADNPDYFEDVTLTTEQVNKGIIWAKRIPRVILPFSNFTPTDDEDKAVVFTVNSNGWRNPSCKLKILTIGDDGGSVTANNYTIPSNSYLTLKGTIRTIMEVEAIAAEWSWGETENDWQMQDRYLHVSQIVANITDYNGARITFSSNMPQVRVLPDVYIGTGATTRTTEETFNDLVLKSGDTSTNGTKTTYRTSRFSYIYDSATQTGVGYMDILTDEYNQTGTQDFRLVLSAEDSYGGKLQREITVKTSQYGNRYNYFNLYDQGYAGAFFRYNETGERIITGQTSRITKQGWTNLHLTGSQSDGTDWGEIGDLGGWRAEILQGDGWLTISSTPSFDPVIGTDNPGDSQNFRVNENEYKSEENGKYVQGRGRIYFKIGATSTLSSASSNPRYGVIRIKYSTGEYVVPNHYIYVRQGEADDYIYQNNEYARKISAFNLTAQEYRNNPNTTDIPQLKTQYAGDALGTNLGTFVKYPSQAGAMFQWGQNRIDRAFTNYYRRAYNPSNDAAIGDWFMSELQFYGAGNGSKTPIWDAAPATGANTTAYDYNYKKQFELCPPGYHTPTDGPTDQLAYNGPYPNIYATGGSYLGKFVDINHDGTVITPYTIGSAPNPLYSDQIAYSELRQSLFKTPLSGSNNAVRMSADANYWVFNTFGRTNTDYSTINHIGNTYASQGEFASTVNSSINYTIGFYADGFFDRRPIKSKVFDEYRSIDFAVSIENADIAYRGVVIFNDVTKASVFFPMPGRKASGWGALQEAGTRGFYLTASSGPSNRNTSQSVWKMSIGMFPPLGFHYQLPSFGESLRCVKNTD